MLAKMSGFKSSRRSKMPMSGSRSAMATAPPGKPKLTPNTPGPGPEKQKPDPKRHAKDSADALAERKKQTSQLGRE